MTTETEMWIHDEILYLVKEFDYCKTTDDAANHIFESERIFADREERERIYDNVDEAKEDLLEVLKNDFYADSIEEYRENENWLINEGFKTKSGLPIF